MKKIVAVILLMLVIVGTWVGLHLANKNGVIAVEQNQAYITLAILAGIAILLITEVIPLALSAMCAPVLLYIFNIANTEQVFSAFSNSSVVLFGGMFIIGASLFESGVAKSIGDEVAKRAKGSESTLLIAILAVSIVVSLFLSNTGSAAVLMPMVISIAASAKMSQSKFLIPMAFIISLTGTITLIGTPPNIIGNGILHSEGLETFGFFEFGMVGVPLTIVGFLYFLNPWVRKLLPDNGCDETIVLESDAEKEKKTAVPVYKKWLSVIILLSVVVAMITNILPLHIVSTIGALVCVITGVISEKKAYQAIDWTTIFLFSGMLPLADAIERTGAGQMLADAVVGSLGENASPRILLSAVFLLTCGLTQFISNTASAALIAPISLAIASNIGANPKALIMTVCVAASCAFLTPICTPPNTLVIGAGKYKFIDYIKLGFPLAVLCYLVAVIVVPIAWPFY